MMNRIASRTKDAEPLAINSYEVDSKAIDAEDIGSEDIDSE